MRPGDKKLIKQIAEKRIKRLSVLAEKIRDKSDRYAALIKRIATRNRIRLPIETKRRICKSCGSFMFYGTNSRVRVRKGAVETTCFKCGHVHRILIK
ncbi:MAG: ribonuclease P [Candidatus Altiarchaeota archaeon]|nr:ribonuclease P [Candidatus Altiarchaeota archaeon]